MNMMIVWLTYEHFVNLQFIVHDITIFCHLIFKFYKLTRNYKTLLEDFANTKDRFNSTERKWGYDECIQEINTQGIRRSQL